jgi:hypothetical protein
MSLVTTTCTSGSVMFTRVLSADRSVTGGSAGATPAATAALLAGVDGGGGDAGVVSGAAAEVAADCPRKEFNAFCTKDTSR